MDSLFLILFFISFLALLIGLIKPNIVLKWLPEAKRNRKSVAMYFGIAAVVFFILFGATASPTNDSVDADNNDQIEQAKEEELKKEQEEKIKEEELKKEQEEKAKEEELKKEQEELAKEEARKKEQENAETKSQQQAVKMAQNYISYTAFSKSGLIDQLEFEGLDRKSTRLNSSHVAISYAVFCLNKILHI